jgi:hypothetical protein
MTIFYNNTEIELPTTANSYRYMAIRQIGSLTLYYSLPQHVEIPIGAWVMFQGKRYELMSPENFKKRAARNFEYTLIMEDDGAKTKKYKFRDTTSNRLKFSLTAKPHEHLQMLIDNMNNREEGWSIGECIDAVEQTLSYNHTSCFDGLNQMAEAFNTEFEIDNKTVHLRKVEYNKDSPLPLSYGRGNGFKPELGRSNFDDTNPVEILFVQGGERNIDASKYGSAELLLPKNQQLEYEGNTYVSDADGFSIRRLGVELTTQSEDSLDCSNIYPSRVGVVSGVEIVDADKHFYDFFDSSIPANLDFSQYRIDGEKMTVIFQTGMLAGKEFDIEQTDDSVTGYIHSERRFKLVPQELDGQTMPNNIFKPSVGDKYAVFGMMLPDAYICDNATKTGASWDMFREAAKYFYEHQEPNFSFTGELDGVWAKRDWLNIGGKIKLGGYILFSDNQFQTEGVLIRIVGIKDYIDNPHSPIIELSNVAVAGTVYTSYLKQIEQNEVAAEDLYKNAISYAKRSYRDAVESMGIIENAMLKNFTESISPITIQTMGALFGDASLQFRFVNNKTNPQKVDHRVTFNNATKVLSAPAGIVQHMTLGISAVAPSHKANEYKFWDIPAYTSPPLDDDKKYYMYVKASTTTSNATFVLSETAIEMNSVSGYYHLWLGFLNSAYEGERTDFVNMNRFTEILPGQITVDVIKDELARLVIDLANARIIAQNGAEIVGKLTISSGSSGYDNIEDKPDLSAYEEAVNFIENTLPDTLAGIREQIDGVIKSWFDTYSPTTSNAPASDWATNAQKEAHLGDTFTNINTGQSWRYTKSGSTYSWALITDAAAAKALADAAKAQDTADKKRRTFVNTPYPPYDVGDLWVQGSTGDIMRCKTARETGSYVASDWEKASKYTDDSTANTAKTNAQNALDKAEAASNAANTADSKAGTAQSTANSAQSTANSAQSTASSAQTTANGKATVFYGTNDPPSGVTGMKTNDLYVSGTLIYRYNGSSWVVADKYDVQMTVTNGGAVNTGAIILGGTGGMAATGTVRIWSGGSGGSTTNGTFRVTNTGAVYSKNSFYVEDANGNIDGGFNSSAAASTSDGAVRFWVGGGSVSAARSKIESSGDMFGMRLYAGNGTRTGSSALTALTLWVGNSSMSASASPSIHVWGNADYPPIFRLYSTNNNSTPFFEITGKKTNDWYNRVAIRCAWLPWKDHLIPYFGVSSLDPDEQKTLKYDTVSGYIYFD